MTLIDRVDPHVFLKSGVEQKRVGDPPSAPYAKRSPKDSPKNAPDTGEILAIKDHHRALAKETLILGDQQDDKIDFPPNMMTPTVRHVGNRVNWLPCHLRDRLKSSPPERFQDFSTPHC